MSAAKFAALVAAVALCVAWPLVAASPALSDYDAESTLGDAYAARGRIREAVDAYSRALAIDRSGALPSSGSAAARSARAQLFEVHARMSMSLGRWQEAARDWDDALRLAPADANARVERALCLAAMGSPSRGSEAVPERDSTALVRELMARVTAAQRDGETEAMTGYLVALNAVVPHWEPAVVGLVRARIVAGDTAGARELLETERAAGLREPVYRVHLAVVLAREGRTEEARRMVDSIPSDMRANDPAVRATLEAFGRW